MKNVPETVKVEGTTFIREVGSMGLSNMDVNARNEYYSKVRMMKTQKDEINTLRSEVSSLHTDLHDIKNLLAQLLDKGTNG
jgi:BMFP domain-containing protein YqiC